jgi:iron-sulfur cluster insertion protein
MIKEINFSKEAVEKINQLVSKKPLGTFFRIAVKGGGCSGFKYDFSFDSKIDNDDFKHENVVIDKSSLNMLKGSQIDFTNELIGNSFKISNPKTKSSCGCGISFSF